MGIVGSGGDIVYVDFPVCAAGPESEKIGDLSFTARDPNALSAIPNPLVGMEIRPRRKSMTTVLPTKNTYRSFPTPND
jgi:hypothetical protein